MIHLYSVLRKSVPLWLFILSVLVSAEAKQVSSIVKVTEYTTETDIALCATLNKYIYSGDGVAAKPYIKLTPNQPFSVEISYNGICLKGLKPRTKYHFTINKGIPLGEFVLDRDYSLSGTTTDYDPSFNFDDDGYILPAKGEISIPIKTTNVKELAISLYRINTKNLIGKINETGLVKGLYSYDVEKISSTDGYFIWQKRLRIQSEANKPKVTAIPVGDFLKERKPGAYILQAQRVDSNGELINSYGAQTQWFMISDIGLYTLRGDGGLTVYTRRLSNAKSYDNVKLELISRNNEVLDRSVSKDGKAFFPEKVLEGKRGLKAKAIYAYGEKDDFSVIDLSKPAHDLSDRGVQGRDNPGKYDAYIFSNRGIFRPGESVPIEILLRDQIGNAQPDIKLSLKLFDSRQVEILSKLISTDKLGHISTRFEISETASTGRWHLKLYAGGERPVGGFDFLVEDFVPPKIKVDIEKAPDALKPGIESRIEASAHYLTGEALPDAQVEVSTILHQSKNPFAGYESYTFGDVTREYANMYIEPLYGKTDAQGKVSIPFVIKKVYPTTLPISAHITLSVSEPGGRPVKKSIDRFIEDKEGYIGIKANFKNGSIDMGSHPIFDIVYLRHNSLQSRTLAYRVVKEDVHWHWRSNGEDWTYDKTYSDAEEIERGTVNSSESEPVTLSLPKLDWGSYRLEVRDENGANILSAYRFGSGYEESMSKASPDRLPVAIDKRSYHIGEEIKVHITPKFSGPIIVSIANSMILETKTVDAKAGEAAELTFTVQREWGSSPYVLATAFRSQSKKLGASRAVGLSPITVVDPEKIIHLSLEYPKRVKSSEAVKVTVKSGDLAGKEAYVTIAAVDEGVLRLTDYQTPDPAGYFFGQQKLGIEIRDIYGDLIKTRGAHAKFNVGAGDELEEALQDKPVANKRKIVALFRAPVLFDKDGKAEVTLNIPDYQGALRVMAVAWSKSSVGSEGSEMLVKDPISPEIYMPRFISVGDKATAHLSVDFDTDAEAGKYEILFSNRNSASVIDRKSFTFDFDGTKRARFFTPVILRATDNLDSVLSIIITKNEKVITQKQWELGVRSRYPQIYSRKLGVIEKDALFDPQALYDSDMWSNPKQISLKISGKPLLASASLADKLIDYSGRCAEQTTSRAMPWLFMPSSDALAKSINVQAIVPQAVEQLLVYQKLDGGFGLWSGNRAEMWISAYVLDFLMRAKKAGYDVPEKNIKVGLDWIENHLDRWSTDSSKQEADAYGLYVLTNAGRTLMSEILHHVKDPKSKIRSAQAWGQLGVALAKVGEKELSIEVFERAVKSLGGDSGDESSEYFSNYGGKLRDETALVILMQESGLGLDWQSRYADLASAVKERKYLSTQELSLLLRASFVANIPPVELELVADGKILPLVNGEYHIAVKEMKELPVIRNQSKGKCWYSFNFKATPTAKAYQQIPNYGFTIKKEFYTMDGKKCDLSNLRQNERLVVVIEGGIEKSSIKYPLVTDWIPAGFELENPHLNGIDPTSGLKWLGEQSRTEHVDYRNDRYVAALSTQQSRGYFRLAYVVRAVTIGSYSMPLCRVEDMYRPYYRALSPIETEQVVVKGSDGNTTPPEPSDNNSSVHKLSESDFEAVYTKAVENMDRYTITQLNFLRNSIFARAGLDFEERNPMLHKMFSNFWWYKQTTKSSAAVYRGLNPLQKSNVDKLLAEEKRRGGGLVLADFYRVKIRALSEEDLKKYDKHQLAILRNSLFARYGVSFKNDEYRQIFSYMPWYHPRDVKSSTVFDALMSEQEKANVQLMLKMEKSAK